MSEKQRGRAAAHRRAAAAAARAEAQRRQRRLRVVVVGVVALVAVLGVVLASIAGGGDDDGSADLADGGTTTSAPSDTSDTTEPAPPADFVEPACPGDEKPAERPAGFTEAPPTCLEDGVDYSAVMVTSQGEITFDLLEDEAPVTVNSFVFLARWGWYDGDDFHRVIQGFMNQGGDPIAEGTGGPGYEFEDELPASVDEYTPGTVAMANSGADTNGSQFFMCVGCEQLPSPDYSIFGRVTSGMEVVEAINALGVPPGSSGPPDPPVTIESVTIVEGS